MIRLFKTLIGVASIPLLAVAIVLSAFATQINTHSCNMEVSYGGGNFAYLVNSGKDKIEIASNAGHLDGYMDEHNLSEVIITADLEEEWISTGQGTGYYKLTFTFGPSGAYFTPDFKLQLRGKYVSDDTQVTLYDEAGEALPFTTSGNGSKITYSIPHFSEYYYDSYGY